jgi:hypothetical protein
LIHRFAAVLLALAVVLVAAAPAAPQGLPVGDPLEDYLRVLQITGRASPGSFTVRPFVLYRAVDGIDGTGHPWSGRFGDAVPRQGGAVAGAAGSGPDARPRLTRASARFRTFLNTGYPAGQNDGAVWQGKGVTGALDVALAGRWRGLSVTVAPTFLYAQNSGFELGPVGVAGMPEYAYPWRRIDYPQRFGPDALWSADPGQSEVRLDFRGATLGFGTRNLWWGPGIRNAIVMSNNAPGFPHAFLGTATPVDIGIGAIEAEWIWGRLAQSDWFDPAVTDTKRFLTGAVLAYSPDFLTGLSLGVTRAFVAYVPDGGVPLGDYFLVFQGATKSGLVSPEMPDGTDETNQLLSLFGRWILPESGFEVYFEWARNDHAWDLTDLVLEPAHSQAYTLGLQKVEELSGGRLLAFRTELTHLDAGPPSQVRGTGTYYEHGVVAQGYTNEGQIIGAAVGPGGNAQYLGADLYAPWGRAGAFVQRRVHDNDAYYDWAIANGRDFCCHHVSLSTGVSALLFVDDFDVGAGFAFNRDLNRYFAGPNLSNVTISLSAAWRRRP